MRTNTHTHLIFAGFIRYDCVLIQRLCVWFAFNFILCPWNGQILQSLQNKEKNIKLVLKYLLKDYEIGPVRIENICLKIEMETTDCLRRPHSYLEPKCVCVCVRSSLLLLLLVAVSLVCCCGCSTSKMFQLFWRFLFFFWFVFIPIYSFVSSNDVHFGFQIFVW